jgi:hypothetical protein
MRNVDSDSGNSVAPVVFVLLLVNGLLLLGAWAVSPPPISPPRTPWPRISETLYLHRSDLAAIAIGTVAIVLVCLTIGVLI